MSKQKRKSSCLGLFFKGFIVSALVLANLCLLAIMAAVKFFGADYATWTDFSHISSYPWMAVIGVVGVSFLLAFVVAALGAAVEVIFGRKEGGGDGTKRRGARPQSNRRTTI